MKSPNTVVLNSLLQDELSAVETYIEVLAKMEDKQATKVLEECCTSHMKRADKLCKAIKELGEIPVSAGKTAWPGLTKLVTKSAEMLGDKAMIAVLEEGEDLNSSDYEWRLVSMHGEYRDMVKDELLPEQELTHKKLSGLVNANFAGVWPPVPEPREV